MSFRTRGIPGAAHIALLALALTGCPGPTATLEILDPVDDAVLSPATDTNPTMPGIQAEIAVQAIGLAVGDEVDLVVDGAIVGTLPTPADGLFTFTDVTLSPGAHELRASARAQNVESLPIGVTVASEECFSINFVTPAASGDRVTLGPRDDTDGEACGATFETTVVVATSAPNGSEARILVNGVPQRTGTVSNGAVRFEGVALDRRAPNENGLTVQIEGASGSTCSESYPVPLMVDCQGASCSITSPDSPSGFLNQSHDVSDEAGFQGNFEVTTDTRGAGQPVRLIINGNETDALSAMPDGMVAHFGNVPLSEGVHRMRAECTDGVGNVTRSAAIEWTVDITACPVSLDSPTEGTVFIDEDDLDPATDGVDIDVSGTAGGDCVETRVALCSAIGGVAYEPAEASFTRRVELGSSATQSLCVEARDAAGNVSRAMTGVRLVTDNPQLEIATPTTGAGFNVAGTNGRTADLNTSTQACEAVFEVYCTGIGDDVAILRQGVSTPLATATCVADSTVPSPYTGLATFSSVPLPTDENGPYNVIARQTADRLTGTSTPIAVDADCVAPQLVIFRPMCGESLHFSMDEAPATPEFEYRTTVLFGNGRAGDVTTLKIRPTGGGSVTYSESRTFAASASIFFNNANYGAGGVLDIEASATDAAGNVGVSAACSVTVEDLPLVNITSPVMDGVVGAADDCDPATPGPQVQVQASTDAPAGSSVQVEIGSEVTATTVAPGGTVSVCADGIEGRVVPVRVSITDPRGTGSASVTIAIDTKPPTVVIEPVTATVVDRRGGTVGFSWAAVEDVGGLTLTGYELRCAPTEIDSEADWNAAQAVAMTTVPGTAGATQSENVGGFRPGETLHCALRGVDPAGALTPLASANPEVHVPFLFQEVSAVGTAQLGSSIEPVGDVNGDGIDDVLIGGNNEAYLYFGSAGGLGSTPDVTIEGGSGWGFAGSAGIAGLGDFNGDGIADFAVSARGFSANKGAAFVFYGRSSTTPWPSTIVVDAVACTGADVCFIGDDGAAGGPDELGLFGWAISAAGDFDGDGLMDLAVGAPGASGFLGRLYLLLGRATLSGVVPVPGSGAGPAGFVLQGGPAHRQLGTRVASLGGDLDGDLRHDVILLSAGDSSASVSAKVDHLRSRAYSGAGLVSISTSTLDLIGSGPVGYGVPSAGVGDVNGDGFLDVAIASPSGAGSVTYYLGARAGFASASTFTITNDSAGASGDGFGGSLGDGRHPWLGVIGDLDGDHLADTIIGAAEHGTDTHGSAHLFYSSAPASNQVRSSGVTLSFTSTGNSELLRVAFIGDVNGDGFFDFALGDTQFNSGEGRLIISY